mmetsp:Transcript_5015/g.15610  ORF Transcript_5015/g.15610 Transcript_5015/m.15610 type:complete len:205 (+) Transcript_5015:498-1112(+)
MRRPAAGRAELPQRNPRKRPVLQAAARRLHDGILQPRRLLRARASDARPSHGPERRRRGGRTRELRLHGTQRQLGRLCVRDAEIKFVTEVVVTIRAPPRASPRPADDDEPTSWLAALAHRRFTPESVRPAQAWTSNYPSSCRHRNSSMRAVPVASGPTASRRFCYRLMERCTAPRSCRPSPTGPASARTSRTRSSRRSRPRTST